MKETSVDQLANVVSIKLGRGVTVHRHQDHFKSYGKIKKAPLKYIIAVEGCIPAFFPGCTVNEAKMRLAMITDLFYSEIIHATSPTNALPPERPVAPCAHDDRSDDVY